MIDATNKVGGMYIGDRDFRAEEDKVRCVASCWRCVEGEQG